MCVSEGSPDCEPFRKSTPAFFTPRVRGKQVSSCAPKYRHMWTLPQKCGSRSLQRQLCEFVKVQGDGEIDVSGMPGLRWKVYLVRNGPDDYKLRSERRTTVLQDSEVSDLVVGKFGHRSGEELAFKFFRRFVRSWIGRIHQLGIDQPRMRERVRLGFSPKRDGTEGTQKNEWPCLVRNDPQLTTKLVRERVDEDWQFQPSIKLLESLSSRPASYRPPN